MAVDETVERLLKRIEDYRKEGACISYRPGEPPAVYTPKPPGKKKPAVVGEPLRHSADYRLPREIMRKD